MIPATLDAQTTMRTITRTRLQTWAWWNSLNRWEQLWVEWHREGSGENFPPVGWVQSSLNPRGKLVVGAGAGENTDRVTCSYVTAVRVRGT